MRSLNIGATGMLAQQLNVEVISNNIANMNTTGFKRQRPEFQDLLYQEQRRVGVAPPCALEGDHVRREEGGMQARCPLQRAPRAPEVLDRERRPERVKVVKRE